MAKLLAIDLDGTLFYPKRIKRCICKKNVKFLRRWIDAGNKLVLVTSRSTQFTERLKDEIKRPVDFITCCSSQIIANDKIIYNEAMPNEKLKNIIQRIETAYEPIALLMTSENHPCIIKTGRKVAFFYFGSIKSGGGSNSHIVNHSSLVMNYSKKNLMNQEFIRL